jgi:proline iminopeptidase
VPLATLYPDSPAWQQQTLPVGDGHEIVVRQHGHAQGRPALVLHGGPGSGCSPLLRRVFDPQRFRIVCVDQRGAGGSRPRGGIEHNTTAHLIDDLRAVRHALGIERWLVAGGSWGATLALVYAAAEPAAVSALLLRSSFLARAEDIAWFFGGARDAAPQAWARLAALAPDPLPWLASTLRDGTEAAQRRAALAWWQWEQALAGTNAPAPDDDAALAALIDRYRVQSHYLINGSFLAERPLLQRCADVPRVPTLLLHGTADRICRPEGARLLQSALPHARLHWIDGAGHDPTHPGMVDATVRALNYYAANARFVEQHQPA